MCETHAKKLCFVSLKFQFSWLTCVESDKPTPKVSLPHEIREWELSYLQGPALWLACINSRHSTVKDPAAALMTLDDLFTLHREFPGRSHLLRGGGDAGYCPLCLVQGPG